MLAPSLFPRQCQETGTRNIPILQTRPGELELFMYKVARPLGGSLDLAFHFSIPPPAFEAQSPRNPETLKPAPARRGRQGQPGCVCLQGTDVQLSDCTEQALLQEGPSGAQGRTSHLPRQSQFSASFLERGEGGLPGYVQFLGVV